MSKDIAEAVVELIRRYALTPDDTNDVSGLISLSGKIATYKLGLSVRVAELYKSKLQAEYNRKRGQITGASEAMKDGKSAAAAKVEAEAATLDLMAAEVEADAEYMAGRLILENAGDVLDTMRQHIAHLRKEQTESHFQNQ